VGAVELVPEQEGLIVRLEGVCWRRVAAAMSQSGESGYDAEDEVWGTHVAESKLADLYGRWWTVVDRYSRGV